MIFVEDRWQKKSAFTLNFEGIQGRIRCNLQALSSEGKLHLFLKFGRTLYYREGLPSAETDDRDVWQPIAEVGTDWVAVLIDGVPVVFHRGTRDSEIVGLRLAGKAWRQVFAYGPVMTSDLGVYPLGHPDRFAILVQSFPGSLRLVEVEGRRVVQEVRHGSKMEIKRG